jgi:hypothetical protein
MRCWHSGSARQRGRSVPDGVAPTCARQAAAAAGAGLPAPARAAAAARARPLLLRPGPCPSLPPLLPPPPPWSPLSAPHLVRQLRPRVCQLGVLRLPKVGLHLVQERVVQGLIHAGDAHLRGRRGKGCGRGGGRGADGAMCRTRGGRRRGCSTAPLGPMPARAPRGTPSHAGSPPPTRTGAARPAAGCSRAPPAFGGGAGGGGGVGARGASQHAARRSAARRRAARRGRGSPAHPPAPRRGMLACSLSPTSTSGERSRTGTGSSGAAGAMISARMWPRGVALREWRGLGRSQGGSGTGPEPGGAFERPTARAPLPLPSPARSHRQCPGTARTLPRAQATEGRRRLKGYSAAGALRDPARAAAALQASPSPLALAAARCAATVGRRAAAAAAAATGWPAVGRRRARLEVGRAVAADAVRREHLFGRLLGLVGAQHDLWGAAAGPRREEGRRVGAAPRLATNTPTLPPLSARASSSSPETPPPLPPHPLAPPSGYSPGQSGGTRRCSCPPASPAARGW